MKVATMALLAWAMCAPAAVIMFDGPEFVGSSFVEGPPPNPASVLTTQLSGEGIVFGRAGVSAGVAVVDHFSPAHSPSNVIAGLDINGEMEAYVKSPIHFYFVVPGTMTPGVTGAVSFFAGDGGSDQDTMIVDAYGLDGTLLDSQVLSGTSWQPYSLVMPGIHRIVAMHVDAHPYGFGVDTLTFETPQGEEGSVVPEPGGAALVALGLAGVAVLRRRL